MHAISTSHTYMFLQIYPIIILYIDITNILILVSLFCLILSKHHIQLYRTTLVQHILSEHNHIQHVAQLHSTTTARTQCIPGNEYTSLKLSSTYNRPHLVSDGLPRYSSQSLLLDNAPQRIVESYRRVF